MPDCFARSYRALSADDIAGGLDDDLAIEALRPLLVAFDEVGRDLVSPDTAIAVGVLTGVDDFIPAFRPEDDGTTLMGEGFAGLGSAFGDCDGATFLGSVGLAAAGVGGRDGPDGVEREGAGVFLGAAGLGVEGFGAGLGAEEGFDGAEGLEGVLEGDLEGAEGFEAGLDAGLEDGRLEDGAERPEPPF